MNRPSKKKVTLNDSNQGTTTKKSIVFLREDFDFNRTDQSTPFFKFISWEVLLMKAPY